MRWEPFERYEQRKDTIDLAFNWIALAAVLRLDGGGARGRSRGPLKVLCNKNDKGGPAEWRSG